MSKFRIRDYIAKVEIAEASWWPTRAAAPKPTAAPPSSPIIGRSKAPAAAPVVSRMREYSIAIEDLYKAVNEQKLGRDRYEQIVHLASVLKDMASEHGMEQFAPLLAKILKDADNCYDTVERLHTEFRRLMASDPAFTRTDYRRA